LLDQLVKLYFLVYQSNDVLLNSGGAFGFANGFALYQYAVILVLFVLAIVLIGSEIFIKNPLPVVLIYAGAVSDLIDRFRLGGVVDYIDIKIWPSFNLADCMIVVGVIYLAVALLRSKN